MSASRRQRDRVGVASAPAVLELRGGPGGPAPLLCHQAPLLILRDRGLGGLFRPSYFPFGGLLRPPTSVENFRIVNGNDESYRSPECTKMHIQAFDISKNFQRKKHRAAP